MDEPESGSLMEWVWPASFAFCMGWVIWQMPAFILDLLPAQNESYVAQITEMHERKEITPNLPGLFGGVADILDWLALVMIPILFFFGAHAPCAWREWSFRTGARLTASPCLWAV